MSEVIDDTVTLRCKYCGAPFEVDKLKSDDTYITCTSCGTTQTKVDAKAYLEQMMGQVRSWISKAIPTGINISQAENVDSVARHSIFINNVKPGLDTELTEYRFGFMSLLSHRLMMLPHRTANMRMTHNSSKVFEFNAKIKSTSALAVDQSSRDMMKFADGISMAYALMLNNTKLLSVDKPGRYELMSTNLKEASDSLKGIDKYDVVSRRFEALSKLADAVSLLEEGKIMDVTSGVSEAIALLVTVRSELQTNMELGASYLSVDMEISMSNMIKDIVEMAQINPSLSPLKILSAIKNIMDAAELPQCGTTYNNPQRYAEILSNVSQVISAMAGKSSIQISSGGGQTLMPFWVVDLRYSFTTGALWNKKSVEVREALLIPATFILTATLQDNPRLSVTDVFGSKPSGKWLDSLKGNQTSISQSGEIDNVISSAAGNSIGARKVILPICTKNEAEKFAVKYLNQCSAAESQLKLIKPEVSKLVYVPCDITDRISLPTLGSMSPRDLGNLNTLKNLSL